MKIALCATYLPFMAEGHCNIVEYLEIQLKEAKHEIETIYLPQVASEYSQHVNIDLLIQQTAAFRFIDLSSADRVICFRPYSHFISHPNKIVWFIDPLLPYNDLWNISPQDLKQEKLRQEFMHLDAAALREAKYIFTHSDVVSAQLKKHHGLDSEFLYPPMPVKKNNSSQLRDSEIPWKNIVEKLLS